jgi:hypothetical protein
MDTYCQSKAGCQIDQQKGIKNITAAELIKKFKKNQSKT